MSDEPSDIEGPARIDEQSYGGALAWAVLWFTAIAIALGIWVSTTSALERWDVVGAPTGVDATVSLFDAIDRPAFVRDPLNDVRILYLGDSTAYHQYHTDAAAGLLEAKLLEGRRHRSIRVLPAVMFGLDAFGYYGLADRVVYERPDLVVMALNLSTFRPQRLIAASRPELGAWIEWRRVPEALMLPLHIVGLSADRLLLYKAIAGLGLEHAWRRVRSVQSAVVKGFRMLGVATQKSFADDGLARLEIHRYEHRVRLKALPGPDSRHTEFGAQQAFGPVLDELDSDNAVLRVVDATLRHFGEAGVPTLVYAVPMNVEHFSKLGIDLDSGLPPSLERIAGVVERNGAHFVDLHALLQDSDFRDPIHFNRDTEPNGLDRVAEALAEHIRRIESLNEKANRERFRPTP